MAEIIKYKFFYTSEEFEHWQKTEPPLKIHGISPLPMMQTTTGLVDPNNGNVATTSTAEFQIFVTYAEYEFPTGKGEEDEK